MNTVSLTEQWRFLDGIDPNYMVSNFGRVKRLQHKSTTGKTLKEKYLTATYSRGYYVVSIKRKQFKLHRLIASAFIPNPENKPHINHINGIKGDNRIENLEWCTSKENSVHAHKIKLIRCDCEHNGRSKLNKQDVLHMRCIWKNKKILEEESGVKITFSYMAKIFGISATQAHDIIKEKYWIF